MSDKRIFKIIFHNQNKIYELYARNVNPGAMYAFVEIEDIIFGENTELVVDPSEEKLKDEFAGVERTFIPMHAVIRIDEVNKQGKSKITEGSANITPFPYAIPPK